ncbi:alpha/beta fold hydrolase [Microbacterium esteraromaticum]|uniref:Alpha/beta fold hydrolase n=1 Tax=Microbacterium esteraromaticum TaxID=57043 RepID=A0A939DY57_9MICO|nr:alpha/beta fold hydrolase [Microbacterium esteraromaticum]MBN8206203.1 alpha/beta fold hydrolase [Microbacterium esteraromaticum]MBN8416358.1 alpha/beta fold hydrolase [Microbacterium esteraromaticum]MCA1306372.1 alpha/beta hydrolase [Microbacterium esteraromaticum]WDH77494.1 alpha/beta fold hydrolase [Microbacterium esteraromaticum]
MKSLRHAAAFALPVVAATAAAAAVAVFSTARRVVTPAVRQKDVRIRSVDTAAQTIELDRTVDTELPGRYGLFTAGSHDYVKLGAVLSADATSVRRKLLTQIAPDAHLDQDAAFSGWYYVAPDELHLPWKNVLIGSPAGPCPAWLFPQSSSTWVIQVHGRGTTRSECLRAVPVFHALGLPVLVVSYRNDGEAPRSRRGSYALGAAEWRDVDAAIGYAMRHGAERIVLMGWSMGGAIALQTAVSSAHREAIAALVLDSPVVDWRTVLRFQAREAGLREPLPALAMGALQNSVMARLSGAEAPIAFDRLDMVARASELDAPVLILHSEDDGFVPADASHALAKARPDLVTMPEISVARHTKLWNYDQSGWTATITDWITAQGLAEDGAPN